MGKFLRYLLAGFSGLALYLGVMQRPYAVALTMKATGQNTECPWGRLLALPWHHEKFVTLRASYQSQIHASASDASMGIERLETPLRPFWVKTSGTELQGRKLIAHLLAEQEWISALGLPEVRKGDTVFDIGAHVGTFSAHALQAGAAKVIMVEPDPTNLECLRRNFAQEIAENRAVVIAAGAWSSESSMDLNVGILNSGTGSLVVKEAGSTTIKVPVRPIDTMIRELGLDRVDVIKMDIEGAEREALKGAANALRKHKPRLMLDAYHLPDDRQVIPQVVQSANPGYRLVCGPCSALDSRSAWNVIPHSLYFQ